MKKYFKIPAILGLTALLAVSCGKKGSDSDTAEDKDAPKEGVIKAETTTVSGDLGECYKVVDREYKPTGEHPTLLTVDLERTSAELPFDLNEYELETSITKTMSGQPYTGGRSVAAVKFSVEMLDADGNVVEKEDYYDSDDCKALAKLKPGEKGTIRFRMPISQEDRDAIVKFRISSEYETAKAEDSADYTGGSSDLSGGSLSGSNWDAVLDEYESYMNQIRAINQRIMNGDTSAASEIASIMSKAQSLEEKLDNARGDMTEAQIQRLQRIITSAVQ